MEYGIFIEREGPIPKRTWRFASSSSDARTNQSFQVFSEEDEGNNGS